MDYKEALTRIHSLNKFGSRPGLDRVSRLLELMGNPQHSLKFVHVAGTNGKGSTCAMVSSVLSCAGYKTGLFISPYITDFCERIQIDGNPIDKAALAEIAEYVFSLTDKLSAEGVIITEFELVMCIAFEYYKRQCCDVVVLEVGLGGRLDSTNVIKAPVCAVITSIGLDHTDILGDTYEAVAGEKCGIIKAGSTVVSSSQSADVMKVIKDTCKLKGTPLIVSDTHSFNATEYSLEGTGFEYKGMSIHLPLVGEHQLQNAATALECIGVLASKGFDKITDDSIRAGFLETRNPARFEVISHNPVVIIDGAHNPDGVSTFAHTFRQFSESEKGILIIGMLSDKDSRSSVCYLKGLFSEVYTVPVSNPRAMSASDMALICREYFEDVTACNSCKEAFDIAYRRACDEGLPLCICGSLYLAAEIRPYALQKVRKV